MDAELLSWLKVIAGSGVTGTALVAGAKWFIVRPVERAEAAEKAALQREADAKKEAERWKDLWKDEQRATDQRIAQAEAALTGQTSMRPHRGELPTMSMLVESTPKRQHDDELQRRLLEDKARALPASTALEAFAPRAPPQLHGKGGRQDYEDRRRRQQDRGEDTPTQAFKPEALAQPFPHRGKLATHRDED